MANIIEEILRAATSEDTPQKTKDAIREAFAGKLAEETDSDVTISYRHKKGTDGVEIQAMGRGTGIITGMYNLLGGVALKLAGNEKELAMEIMDSVVDGARRYINDRGGGINDAQDCAEEAED